MDIPLPGSKLEFLASPVYAQKIRLTGSFHNDRLQSAIDRSFICLQLRDGYNSPIQILWAPGPSWTLVQEPFSTSTDFLALLQRGLTYWILGYPSNQIDSIVQAIVRAVPNDDVLMAIYVMES